MIDCESAVVWSRGGPLQLGQSSPIEVLFRLAAAPLLEQGPLDRWAGVKSGRASRGGLGSARTRTEPREQPDLARQEPGAATGRRQASGWRP